MLRISTCVLLSVLLGGMCGYLLPAVYLLLLTVVALCLIVFVFSKSMAAGRSGKWGELAAAVLITPAIFIGAFMVAMWTVAILANIEIIAKAFLSLNSA